ncbi:MAG TPA: Gfo/Idh/MocA family oxidoreductase [Chitinophaga sp.]
MLETVIDTYKQWRRKKVLRGLFNSSPCFAFLGVGQHSMDNLYPVLLNRRVRIKYLYSRQLQVAQQAASLFPACEGIADTATIWNDPEVRGVFICMKNAHQLPLVKEALQAGKYVFVEKPALTTYADWQELAAYHGANKCMIAFNKRFSPLNKRLEKQISAAYSYQARYLTGAYPEGDALMELFCHPVDNVLQLFGPVLHYHLLQHARAEGSIHLQLLLQHEKATGTLELSTCYSWALFSDTLHCLSAANSIEITYPGAFRISPLGKRLAGIPAEKIFNTGMQPAMYSPAGTLPIAANNPIVQQGYWDEISYFVSQVQQGGSLQRAAPATYGHTFRLLDQLQQAR